MNKLTKINNILKSIIVFSLFLLVIGLSYAYFTANISGSESTTTITVSGGTMNFTFAGGSNITMSNIYPKAAAWGTKTFTVTGNNTTDLTMYYNLTLVVTTNTFTSGALKYTLTSTNTGSNGTVVPSATLQDISTGVSSIVLGNGTFVGPTNGNKVHSYTLDFYFPDTGKNQNENKGKAIAAYVKIEEGIIIPNELKDRILVQYGGASSIITAPAGTFASMSGSTDNLMYKMDDDYGTSYYFRGAKDYIKNNLIFANFQWKIIRIIGNGSVRIIYNGTCPNNSCTINSTGTSTQMGTKAYNSTIYNDNKYVGYMYGGAAGVASTSREQATTNETNSIIKTYLDTWYNTNINLKGYASYISDTLFCNDRQLQSEVGGPATGTGYGTSATNYATYNRLYYNYTKAPDLKCDLKNDRFTVDDTTVGNGALTYPVGLLTADEGAAGGIVTGLSSLQNYLFTAKTYWTLSPYKYESGAAGVSYVNGDTSNYSYNVYQTFGFAVF